MLIRYFACLLCRSPSCYILFSFLNILWPCIFTGLYLPWNKKKPLFKPALCLFLSLSSPPILSFCQRLRDSKTVVVANVSSAVILAVFCCQQTCRPQSPNWYQQLSGSRPAWTDRQRFVSLRCCLGDILEFWFNPLKPELNPICYLLALLGAHHFLHVSRIRVKLITLR